MLLTLGTLAIAAASLAYAQRNIAISTLDGPTFTTADVGDTVSFLMLNFFANDGVAQTTFDSPCEDVVNGFRSGTTNDTVARNFTIRITTEEPIFWAMTGSFPSGAPRCQTGAVGTINANISEFLDFVDAASATPFGNFSNATDTSPVGVGIGAVTVSLNSSTAFHLFPLPNFLNPNSTSNGSIVFPIPANGTGDSFPNTVVVNGTAYSMPSTVTMNGTAVAPASTFVQNGTTFWFPPSGVPLSDLAAIRTVHPGSYAAAVVLGIGWALTLLVCAVLYLRNRAIARRARARWVATSSNADADAQHFQGAEKF